MPIKPRPSLFRATASHCFENDTVEALGDGLAPTNSNDQSIPRFTWWDHRGTKEWVQFDFGESKRVSYVEVYWFDDTGAGQCRLPKSWRVLYLEKGHWLQASSPVSSEIARDQWNKMAFQPVNTAALKIEVELQPNYSGGILEWRVR